MSEELAITGDAELTAYIDGELDAGAKSALERRLAVDQALAARLEDLRGSDRDYRGVYAALLAGAPAARLDAILAGALAKASAAAPSLRTPRPRPVWLRYAAAVVLFLAGAVAGALLLPVIQPPVEVAGEPPNWRAAVADYLSLYTRDTLASIPDNAEIRQQELATAGEKLALDLAPQRVALPDLDLKRVQLFQFRGKALAQLAYLAPADGPVAFCIIASGAPDAPPKFEEREGQNIVFWAKDGRGYLVIGRTPRENLEAMAARLQASVS